MRIRGMESPANATIASALCIYVSLPHESNIEFELLVGGAHESERVAVVFLRVGRAGHNVAQIGERVFAADAPGPRMHCWLRGYGLGRSIDRKSTRLNSSH